MCAKCWLVFFQVFIVVASDKGGPRQSRFFTFNTVNDDIRGLPTINVNPASLALGGVMVIATTVLIPFLVKNYAYDYPHRRYAKLLQVADFDNSEFLDFASQMLSDTRSVRGCALRVACWTGQMPDSTDFMRTWDQVLRNKLLSTMVNATAVHDAMLSGHAGRDCSTYNPCPLQEHHFPLLVKHITRVTRGEPES
ncbi:uncharacterized protein LOC135080520 isoform X2 [Ostrinia nubilalis]|uniref:uncharacterized protein LOC135080520 isoform X2 n=1 Tax=Ostrinia nubilalis TaxID=29057 RepID=UPI0030824394